MKIEYLITYHAARIIIGPPTNDNGAKMAPLNQINSMLVFIDINFYEILIISYHNGTV